MSKVLKAKYDLVVTLAGIKNTSQPTQTVQFGLKADVLIVEGDCYSSLFAFETKGRLSVLRLLFLSFSIYTCIFF